MPVGICRGTSDPSEGEACGSPCRRLGLSPSCGVAAACSTVHSPLRPLLRVYLCGHRRCRELCDSIKPDCKRSMVGSCLAAVLTHARSKRRTRWFQPQLLPAHFGRHGLSNTWRCLGAGSVELFEMLWDVGLTVARCSTSHMQFAALLRNRSSHCSLEKSVRRGVASVAQRGQLGPACARLCRFCERKSAREVHAALVLVRKPDAVAQSAVLCVRLLLL